MADTTTLESGTLESGTREPDTFEAESLIPNRPRWMNRARCRGLGTTLFFGDDPADTDRARAYCDECPVRADCLEFALADRSLVGVWAGTDERERRAIRRKRRAA